MDFTADCKHKGFKKQYSLLFENSGSNFAAISIRSSSSMPVCQNPLIHIYTRIYQIIIYTRIYQIIRPDRQSFAIIFPPPFSIHPGFPHFYRENLHFPPFSLFKTTLHSTHPWWNGDFFHCFFPLNSQIFHEFPLFPILGDKLLNCFR